MKKNVTTVDFHEIFHFAKKAPFNISWNECNDLFFNGPLTYKGYNEIRLQDLEGDLAVMDPIEESDTIKTLNVLIAFMKKHDRSEILVLND